jgi:hypothetical protein
MKKITTLLCMAMAFGCGNSPSTTSTNANNTNSGQTDLTPGGGKIATPSPTLTPAAQANADKKIVEVKFPKGATEASYTDSFVGYGLVEYQLVANADQQMTVEIMKSDDDRASFTVMQDDLAVADDASEVTGWSGILPQTGKYTISVGQSRAFARRDDKPVKFTIRIRIV